MYESYFHKSCSDIYIKSGAIVMSYQTRPFLLNLLLCFSLLFFSVQMVTLSIDPDSPSHKCDILGGRIVVSKCSAFFAYQTSQDIHKLASRLSTVLVDQSHLDARKQNCEELQRKTA